ncbi:WD40-repeat-containing domain protein [Blakeslea trispora]|nr:WD40-repeat-containing domain protein [Blakeslea trispora]
MSKLSEHQITLYPSIVHHDWIDQPTDYVCKPATTTTASHIDTYVQHVKSTLYHCYQEKFAQLETTASYKKAKAIYDQLDTAILSRPDPRKEAREANRTLPVQCIVWHPHLDILAVADRENHVLVYEKKGHVWSCHRLEHALMKDITALEWKQRSAGTLAVACKQGVCVWTVPRVETVDSQPYLHPSATMTYLTYAGHDDISAIAWDNTPGHHALAVGSANSNAVVVFDLLLQRTNVLKRYGHGTLLLRWSPDGDWLYATDKSTISRMWDTKTWKYKSIHNPSGLYVQAACWAPDNRCLIFSMFNKPDIHMLFINGKRVNSLMDHSLASLSLTDLTTETGETVQTGGIIRDITVDQHHGQRLAVAFQDSPLIALYVYNLDSPLNLTPQPMLFPVGYMQPTKTTLDPLSISNIKDDLPFRIVFSRHHGYGTVMAILWKSGLISFTTHHYTKDSSKRLS